ncbi:hypothetical protein CPB86DRAFT_798817 [Serendipita vermifera]|nr:hypothetical protein CPB86DRAFT_798817 [Serendipita vermifera]
MSQGTHNNLFGSAASQSEGYPATSRLYNPSTEPKTHTLALDDNYNVGGINESPETGLSLARLDGVNHGQPITHERPLYIAVPDLSNGGQLGSMDTTSIGVPNWSRYQNPVTDPSKVNSIGGLPSGGQSLPTNDTQTTAQYHEHQTQSVPPVNHGPNGSVIEHDWSFHATENDRMCPINDVTENMSRHPSEGDEMLSDILGYVLPSEVRELLEQFRTQDLDECLFPHEDHVRWEDGYWVCQARAKLVGEDLEIQWVYTAIACGTCGSSWDTYRRHLKERHLGHPRNQKRSGEHRRGRGMKAMPREGILGVPLNPFPVVAAMNQRLAGDGMAPLDFSSSYN